MMMTENSRIVQVEQFDGSARLEELREFARTEYSKEEASWFLTEIRKKMAGWFDVHQGGRLCQHAETECPHVGA